MQYPRKIYCIGTGLGNAIAFKFSENRGKLMENAVFLELKRHGKEVFYWKGKGEVDFIIREGLKVTQLIQVCHDIEDIDTRKRETSALLEAMEDFQVKESLIITWDYEGEEKLEGKKIIFTPLWK